MRPARVAAILALVAASLLAAGWLLLERWLETPLAVGAEPARIEIPRGQPLAHTARELERRGLLEHARLLAIYASLTGADSKIRAGEYDIPPGTTPRALLALLESGAVSYTHLTLPTTILV